MVISTFGFSTLNPCVLCPVVILLCSYVCVAVDCISIAWMINVVGMSSMDNLCFYGEKCCYECLPLYISI